MIICYYRVTCIFSSLLLESKLSSKIADGIASLSFSASSTQGHFHSDIAQLKIV